MSVDYDSRVSEEFYGRLEDTLRGADRARRRLEWYRRLRRALPIVLLAGPILAWHLMGSSAGGVRASLDFITWLALMLDVAVHVNSRLLTYLDLQPLPVIVGSALFVLVAVTLLTHREERS